MRPLNPSWFPQPLFPRLIGEGWWGHNGKKYQPSGEGGTKQFSLNKFFDPSTPSMRKGRGGEKKQKKKRMKIVATTSLPAVDRPNADRWNAARSRQF